MNPNAPIKAWSFSLLKDFEACPYRVYLMRVERSPQPEIGDQPDHPLVRGDRIHKEAEAYIKGEGALTPALRKVEPELTRLRELYPNGVIEVEQKWAFARDWTPVEWNDPRCWLRVICDVVDHSDPQLIDVIDWKTGKSFGNEVKHQQQQQLYGLVALIRYATAALAKTCMSYVDEGKTKRSSYNRSAAPALLQRWEQRADRLTNAITFPAKPNRGNCRFCPFGIENGTGACPYAVSMEK